MTLQVPVSMEVEHEELHHDLAKALRAGGQTAEEAKKVAAALHMHFEKEEAIALPPLGILSALVRGEMHPDLVEAERLSAELEVNLPTMLAEHQSILAALDRLIDVARAEGHLDVIKFAERLKLHAEMEEQVSYPAAILVGKYIRALNLEQSENEAGLS